MDPNDPNAGTPAVPAGGSEPVAAGTPAPDAAVSEAGNERKPVEFDLAMSWKEKAERANALADENQRLQRELEAREPRGGGQPPTNPSAADTEHVEDLQAYVADLDYRSRSEDANERRQAKFELGLLRRQVAVEEHFTRELSKRDAELAISRLPEAQQAAVRAELSAGRAPDVATALDLVRGKGASQLEQENAQLRAQLAALSKAPPPATYTPAGGGLGAPVGGGAAEALSTDEYNRRALADPEGTLKAYRAGKIRLTGR